ncbi:aldehyde dehydrogenase [Flavobacterium sp. GT3R68]|uniref:aldehyde dehydrogenase n=1 Tax=Flavobacterium sp. GT3R68 TaxID=2594437 RepID=UPI000F86589F|nr:aldehyde dehydrogenase [Flavobacterium sp. GT3R68]RTY94954.1 aldehyde dehydrogenase [Flavobacterium sp. GSN2]TRW91758.1 aldehyde dehydrogenase [Flavobacterium sp. GT3R68]
MNYKSDITFRKESLKKLLFHILKNEEAIIKALYDDFKKPAFETVLTETHFVISDLKNTIKKIKSWSKPKKVFPSIVNFPSKDYIYSEPYGKVLIIAPWNYPFQLALCPLIAAVAAGNQVVLKPSELTPNTSKIIAKIIWDTFDANHVLVSEGGPDVAQQLLTQRWDYIFFTGSVNVGKMVAKAAAEHLTPLTLELGGKNPCIVDETANLKLAAKRIVWGKFLNAGQTCIAPDYILVQNRMKTPFINFLKQEITAAYGENPETSPDYPRIINHKNWQRLVDMLKGQSIAIGGQYSKETLYLAPTLVENPDIESLVMVDEIFGPILPILTYETDIDLQHVISKYEKPLAFYVFTENKSLAEKIIADYSFGGGCVNDTMIQFSNKRLPFGGVGNSGMGAYHGKLSFDIFSHKKAIIKKSNFLDIPIRYAPYGTKLKTLRQILKWL